MKPKELNHLKQTLLSLKSSDFESFSKPINKEHIIKTIHQDYAII